MHRRSSLGMNPSSAVNPVHEGRNEISMNLNIFKKRKSGLTLVVATTLLFAGPVAAHAATTGADNTTDANGATSASADGNNGIVGTEPGASTATGGIKIAKTTIGGRYGDKYSVNTTLDIRVDYTGENVTKGATFSVGLGDGLQVPNGFNSVDLKATALDGTEKKIGKCTASGGTFDCVVTEDIAATLGGNGSLKNGFVKLEAVLTKASVGKTNTTVVVDGTTYTVGLGKGVVGEPVTKGDGKFCWSEGKTAEGLYKFGCWVQAQGQPGQTITITETRDDATYQGGVTMTTVDGDWANPIDWNNIGVTKPKVTKSADGKSATFTIPSELSGDHMARIRVVVVTSEKEMTNKATVNNKEVSTTATWRAKGSSGAETGEDEKPAPAPESKETPKETPSQPKPSTPATPDKPGNSTTEHKGAVTGLAQTGASDTGLMIAGATALVTAGGIALLLRRRQNNN